MYKISIRKRWQLDESDSNYPKNDTAYKTKKCTNRWPCKFQGTGKCLFWHHESERDYWNYVRETAKRTGHKPAEIDKEIKRQNNAQLQKQNLLAQGKLAVGSERPKKEEKERGTSPFEYGLGGRKKRKSLLKKKRTKKVKKRRRRTKKRKSRKRRRTKRKKK